MAGNLSGLAEEGEERERVEEEASATTYFFSPESCPTIGGDTPENKVSRKISEAVIRNISLKRTQWAI